VRLDDLATDGEADAGPSISSPCARLNIEKISSPSSGGTPTPLSRTLNSHAASRRSAEMATHGGAS
jgi:hypothetical protein